MHSKSIVRLIFLFVLVSGSIITIISVSASGSTFLLSDDILLGFASSDSGSGSKPVETKKIVSTPIPTTFNPTPAPTQPPIEPTDAPTQPSLDPEPTTAPEQPTLAPVIPTAAPSEPTLAPVIPTASKQSTSNKVPSNSSNNKKGTSSDSSKGTLNQDQDIGIPIKSTIDKRTDYIREQVYKSDNKWIIRTIYEPEVDMSKGEVCFKVSLKYMDNAWNSLRASAYMYFDIFVDDSGSQTGVRFKSINGTKILNPKVNIDSIIREFEQKTNKALDGKYFWPDDTAPNSFRALSEKSN